MTQEHFRSKEVPSNFSHNNASSNTFRIILISILFFLFLLVSKRDKIEEIFGISTETNPIVSGFVLGEEVSVEGILTQDGDFVTHTHKLTTLTSGIFGLKSKTVNLNQYSGTVLIEGKISSEHQGLMIIDVTKVLAQFFDEQLTGEIESGVVDSVGVYLPQSGIYFPEDFFSEYIIVSSGSNKIEIKSLNSDMLITIDYFLCKKGDSNKDCKQLLSTFSSSNDKTFTTQDGMNFYKLAEVNSWFFANQELIGYFINDVPEQEVTNLSSHLVFPTMDYIKNNLEPDISSLCKAGNIIMNTVTKTVMFIDKGMPVVTLIGTWEKGTAECTILLDLSLNTLGTVKSFSYEEIELTGGVSDEIVETDNEVLSDSKLDEVTDVVQFPLFLDKPLIFTSSRGHSISFPSPRISYSSVSVSENLDTAGVNCYVATNVIEYAKKNLIDSEPSLIVYECKVKEGVEISSGYRAVKVSDGRVFVVSVIDPSWTDFGNNIQVTIAN